MSHKIEDGILFTDLYQLTMAQLYFRQGLHEIQFANYRIIFTKV